MFLRTLMLFLALALCQNASAARTCDQLIEPNPILDAKYVPSRSDKSQIMSDQMKAFWRTFSPEEQLSLVLRFRQFWQTNFQVATNWDDALGRFVELTQWTVNAPVEYWPRSYDAKWLKQFYLELQSQSNTSQEVKEQLGLLSQTVRP